MNDFEFMYNVMFVLIMSGMILKALIPWGIDERVRR